jgi:hypothetical protein
LRQLELFDRWGSGLWETNGTIGEKE